MGRRRSKTAKILLWAAAGLVAGILPAPAGRAAGDFRTPNVRVVAQHRYFGGTEIAFAGDLIFAGQNNGRVRRGELPGQGGVKIFRSVGGRFPLIGAINCPGTDTDVTVVRPGLIAVAHHQSACNPVTRRNGVFLADVSNPTKPRVIGGVEVRSGHTLTVHPSGNFIYVSPGGLANASGQQAILDVRNPRKPTVAATFRPSELGCHDLQFHPSKALAYCAGLGEVQVWDVSNPIAPRTVQHVVNPAIQFAHNALVSPGGRWLVINDEAFGLHACEGPARLYGSLWIYDLRVPDLPVLAGRIEPPEVAGSEGSQGWIDEWCTAHNYNFVSENVVASSWFTGGTRVHDITNPLTPVELATYRPGDAIAYTAHWNAGHLYVNDSNRGLEVLRVDLPHRLTAANSLPPIGEPRVELTGQLTRDLPPRPAYRPPTLETTAYCVIPTYSPAPA